MRDNDDDLRDELLAILAANRELPADSDAQLVDAFLMKLDRDKNVRAAHISRLHQHVSRILAAIPLSRRQIFSIGFLEVAVVALFGYGLIALFGIDTNNDYWVPHAMPLWDALAFLWFIQMVLTVSILAVFRPETPELGASNSPALRSRR